MTRRTRTKVYPDPPAQIEPYYRVLGREMTVRFLMTFGGAELYIGHHPKEAGRLARTVGLERARALGRVRDLLPVRVPLAKHWIAHVMHVDGISKSEIARRLRITDVSVRRLLSEPVTGPRSDE